MVRDSVNAYVEKDLDLARKVMENDDVVDELFEEVKTTLINFIAENKGLQGVEGNRSDHGCQISGAYCRPCNEYRRVGGILNYRNPQIICSIKKENEE